MAYDEDHRSDRERSGRRESDPNRSPSGDWRGRMQGGSPAHRGRDYYADEGRYRGSQRVSPGGEYLYRSQNLRTESYTDQGYGENRGHSDWRTEDRLYDQGGDTPQEFGSSSYGADSQHRGRGPRGYRRSDTRIHEDVCEALTEDPRLDASSLEVSVSECEVTLTGTVSSRDDKRLAEDLAEAVSGVRDVHNQLRVTIGQPGNERAASPSARH